MSGCPFHTSAAAEATTAAPPLLSAESVAIVKATAAVVAEHARKITDTFYQTMFTNNPEALAFFNKTNQKIGKQPKALANAVVAFALNIESLGNLAGAVDIMAHKHCGLNVLPVHYSIVESNMMLAIAAVLGDAVTPEIAAAWNEALKALSKILYTREEELYATHHGPQSVLTFRSVSLRSHAAAQVQGGRGTPRRLARLEGLCRCGEDAGGRGHHPLQTHATARHRRCRRRPRAY